MRLSSGSDDSVLPDLLLAESCHSAHLHTCNISSRSRKEVDHFEIMMQTRELPSCGGRGKGRLANFNVESRIISMVTVGIQHGTNNRWRVTEERKTAYKPWRNTGNRSPRRHGVVWVFALPVRHSTTLHISSMIIILHDSGDSMIYADPRDLCLGSAGFANVSAYLQALVAEWRHCNLIVWRLGSSRFLKLELDSSSRQVILCWQRKRYS